MSYDQDSNLNHPESPLLAKSSSPNRETETFVTYKIRWLVLFVFFSHILYTNLAWSNVDSIAELAECYYNVNVFWINGLSYLFFITYVLFFVLATWFLEKFGLKWAAIVSGCLGAAGGWIKFAGAGPQYFWLLLPGQALASVPNIIEWSAPALLSAVWFPPNERAIATTLVGAIAPQVGILISLVLGPAILKNSQTTTVCNETYSSHNSFEYVEWQSDIYNKMFYYLLGQAIFATLLVPIAFIIPAAPPTPPSASKNAEDHMKKMTILESLLSLIKNWQFMLFVIVFGMMLGVAAVYVTVYEEVYKHTGYEEEITDYGSYLGLSIQVAAIIVLIGIGKWIDFTKTFYGTSLVVCFGSSLLGFGLALGILFKLSFFIVCVLGTLTIAFVAMFQGVAYEFGVEMTFPVQEGISVSLLNAISQIVATVITLIASAMIKANAVYVFFFLAACSGFGFIIQIFVKPRLRRVEQDSLIDSSRGCCVSSGSSSLVIQAET